MNSDGGIGITKMKMEGWKMEKLADLFPSDLF